MQLLRKPYLPHYVRYASEHAYDGLAWPMVSALQREYAYEAGHSSFVIPVDVLIYGNMYWILSLFTFERHLGTEQYLVTAKSELAHIENKVSPKRKFCYLLH